MALPNLPSTSSLASLSRPGPRPPVSYVLLAEFDIDEGSVLKHQYPVSTGTDEHLLAEHMLPDGAHDRQEDWTIFYLNQIPPLTVNESVLVSAADAGDSDAEGTRDSGGKGKGRASDTQSEVTGHDGGLLYVMSLVRTKKDATVRRGALVKALAVATHSPYIQIYKPILLLALEDYYNEPSVACLSRLYNAINAMDLSTLPLLSLDERLILRTSERKDMFEEKFADSASTTTTTTDGASSSIHLRRTPSSQSLSRSNGSTEVLDTFDHRSGSSGSISSLTSISKDPGTYDNSTDDLSWRTRSRANTVNSSEDGRPQFAGIQLMPGGERATTPAVPSGRPKDTHWFDSKIEYNGIQLPIRLPLATFPDEIGDYSLINLVQTFSSPGSVVAGPLHPHLHTNGPSTHPIVVLFNALVTHKRVVFLGHGQPAGQVANLVLAACALGSGCGSVLQGFTERAFPYTNLSNLDNLQGVPGFIAGVCNPAFADRPSWWDVLCNMETGKIIVSKDIRPPAFTLPARTFSRATGADGPSPFGGADEMDIGKAPTAVGATTGVRADAKAESPDNVFMDEITNAIQAHYGEAVIRARFTDYVQRFVRLASRYDEETGISTSVGYPCASFVYGELATLGGGILFADEQAAARELTANIGRIEGWRATPSYGLYKESFQAQLQDSPLQGFDLAHQLSRLRQSRKMVDAEVGLIIRTLADQARTHEQVVAILAHLPPHFGGLLPLAFALFHPSPEVRSDTLDLFGLFEAHPTGRKFIQSLNAFHRSAYTRQAQERENQREANRASVRMSPRLTSRPPLPPPKE